MLNPLLTRVIPEHLVTGMLYSGLTLLAQDMTAKPDLAQSWSHDDALTTWTFVLRPGLTFHDGSTCTARDVVATFKAILDPKTAPPARTNVGPIDRVEPTAAGLVINAFYATQQIFDKAYGNYLGLAQLGAFMAHEMGMPLARLNVMVGIAKLERITKSDADFAPLVPAVQALINPAAAVVSRPRITALAAGAAV